MPTEEILAAKKGKDVIEKSNTARSLRHCCGNLDTGYNSRSDRIVPSQELSLSFLTTWFCQRQRQYQLYMSSAIPGKIQVLSM